MDPIQEKHAIDMMSEQIRIDIDSGLLKAKLGYLKAWYKYGLRYSPETDLYPTIRAELVEELCAEARKNEEVFELVKFFAGKRVLQEKIIPRPMSKLIGDYLLGEFAPIGPGSGRRKNWGRDIIILMAMKYLLRSYDLHATHRRNLLADPNKGGKRKRSASELVQVALVDTAIGAMDVGRINRIWENKEKQAELIVFWNLRTLSGWDDEPEAVRI